MDLKKYIQDRTGLEIIKTYHSSPKDSNSVHQVSYRSSPAILRISHKINSNFIQTERRALKKTQGYSNTPEMLEIFDFPAQQITANLREYIAGYSIKEIIDNSKPIDKKSLKKDLTQIVEYLHSLGIARLDMRTHNVIVTPKGTPVFFDLDYVKFLEDMVDTKKASATQKRKMATNHDYKYVSRIMQGLSQNPNP